MTAASVIVERARTQMGVLWVHQGRVPGVALDCAGLVLYALDKQDVPDYGRNPAHGKLEAAVTHFTGTQPLDGVDDIRPGDIVVMAYGGDGRHVGIVAQDMYGQLTIIHSDSMVGCVTEHPLDTRWRRRVRHVWRVG